MRTKHRPDYMIETVDAWMSKCCIETVRANFESVIQNWIVMFLYRQLMAVVDVENISARLSSSSSDGDGCMRADKSPLLCPMVRCDRKMVLWEVWYPYLLLTATEHGHDGQTDWLHGERGRPVVRQYRQADVTVGVNVWVDRYVVAYERYL